MKRACLGVAFALVLHGTAVAGVLNPSNVKSAVIGVQDGSQSGIVVLAASKRKYRASHSHKKRSRDDGYFVWVRTQGRCRYDYSGYFTTYRECWARKAFAPPRYR